ncbi:MAG: hypothetical protein JXD22_10695 [Sedimentisphaerales bacterium]|nr:hypothetical protein [Sedimentisphaerales bacterium]
MAKYILCIILLISCFFPLFGYVEQAEAQAEEARSSVKMFAPVVRDQYYPAGEKQQFEQFLKEPEAEQVASINYKGKNYKVLEKNFEEWGLYSFISDEDEVVTIRKAVGNLRAIKSTTIKYPEGYIDEIIASKTDIPGERIMSGADDPSFENCVGFLPEVEGYTFLSTESTAYNYIIDPSGQIGHLSLMYGYKKSMEKVAFDPDDYLPVHSKAEAKRGLLGNYLPAIDYGFHDVDNNVGWELTAFAGPDQNLIKPKVLICLKTDNKGIISRKYFSLIANNVEKDKITLCEAGEFFSELLQCKEYYEKLFADAMAIDVPDPRVVDTCKASLLRSFITYEYSHPKYGVGYYQGAKDDTFPPTTTNMVNACIEWNMYKRAQRYLDYFVDNIVSDDGVIKYYGPAVDEYGQLLDTAAQYVRYSGNDNWLIEHKAKITAIINHFRDLHQQSRRQRKKGELCYGMISGVPEADIYREEVRYYFSGNMWIWRGLTETGRVMRRSSDSELRNLGKILEDETGGFYDDIMASLVLVSDFSSEPVFLSPVAQLQKPFETMTQDRFASYTNFRYYAEMLASDFLPVEYKQDIIEYRRQHGGELMAMTRFMGHLDDLHSAKYGYNLLKLDRVKHFLLGYYAHIAHHQMRGTFNAYEQVNIQDEVKRTYKADYCVPAQLVTPLLTKWMLVLEEKDQNILWLCRATPRNWLDPEKQGITVERASTSWGLVDFAIIPGNNGGYDVAIELPEKSFPEKVNLRIRQPGGKSIKKITGDYKANININSEQDYILISDIESNKIVFNVR